MSVKEYPNRKQDNLWQIRYRDQNGKQKAIKFEGTKADAYKIESELRGEIKPPTLKISPSIVEVFPDYIRSYALSHKQGGTDRKIRAFKSYLLPFFGKFKFTSLNKSLIEKYQAFRLGQGVKHITVNMELKCLQSICKYARELGYHNGIEIKLFPPRLCLSPIPDVPTSQEIKELLPEFKDEVRGLVCCLYYAGMRFGEAASLEVKNVNLVNNQLTFVGQKDGKDRIIPILPELKEELAARIDQVKSGLLWPAERGGVRGDIRASIKAACNRVGTKRHYHAHLFRHAFGTHAVKSGIAPSAVQKIMGHSSILVTQLYVNLNQTDLAEEIQKFTSKKKTSPKKGKLIALKNNNSTKKVNQK